MIMETKGKFVDEPKAEPGLIFCVPEVALAMAVANKAHRCRNTEVVVECVAYSGFYSNLYAIAGFAVVWVNMFYPYSAVPEEVDILQ